jgi:hypothetical protein
VQHVPFFNAKAQRCKAAGATEANPAQARNQNNAILIYRRDAEDVEREKYPPQIPKDV